MLTQIYRSGVYSRGRAKAYIDLDPQDERDFNLHHLYPAMVAACLILQIGTYLLMYRIMKPGGIVFRPREEEKMEQYRLIHGLTGSPADREMMRRESEAAPLLLPPAAMGSPYPSPILKPMGSPHLSPMLKPMGGPQGSPRLSRGYGEAGVGWDSGNMTSPMLTVSEHEFLGSPPEGRRSGW